MWAISQLVSADSGPSISTPFSVTVAIWNWKKAELPMKMPTRAPTPWNPWGLLKGQKENFPQSENRKFGNLFFKSKDPGIATIQSRRACQLESRHLYYSYPSPGYKNGHLGNTALAYSVPLALGPQSGSGLAASPELLAGEAREMEKHGRYQGVNTHRSQIHSINVQKKKVTVHLLPHQSEFLPVLTLTWRVNSRASLFSHNTLSPERRCQHIQPPDYKESHLPSSRDPGLVLTLEFQGKNKQTITSPHCLVFLPSHIPEPSMHHNQWPAKGLRKLHQACPHNRGS